MTLKPLFAAAALSAAMAATAPSAQAGPDPFIGEIMTVGYNFCPRGWTEANGQLLSIAQNSALFSLYGTFYGGDGRTTFALPDLRGRTMVGVGQGPGLSNYQQGARGGIEHSAGAGAASGGNHTGASQAGAGQAGGGTNMQPYLVLRHCVALVGVFPARN